jgi:hypothetical protein
MSVTFARDFHLSMRSRELGNKESIQWDSYPKWHKSLEEDRIFAATKGWSPIRGSGDGCDSRCARMAEPIFRIYSGRQPLQVETSLNGQHTHFETLGRLRCAFG